MVKTVKTCEITVKQVKKTQCKLVKKGELMWKKVKNCGKQWFFLKVENFGKNEKNKKTLKKGENRENLWKWVNKGENGEKGEKCGKSLRKKLWKNVKKNSGKN